MKLKRTALIIINFLLLSLLVTSCGRNAAADEMALSDEAMEVLETVKNTAVLETAFFDIDGNGFDEELTLYQGNTSGLRSFFITAAVEGEIRYVCEYRGGTLSYPDFGAYKFETDPDGKLMLAAGEDYQELYDITVKGDRIIVSKDGREIGANMMDLRLDKKIRNKSVNEN